MTAPSGTGKTTVARQVFQRFENLKFSVSHTTRPARAGEAEGEDYYFVGEAVFDGMVVEDAFAEWAHVHKRRYGTSKAEVERILELGQDILLDVDVQGARSLRRVYPRATSIFLLPPSFAELAQRLKGRATDSSDQVATRLKTAQEEVLDARDFQHVIVNENVDQAALAFGAILENRPSPAGLRHDHVDVLLDELRPS